MSKPRIVELPRGVVTDMTITRLILAGWKTDAEDAMRDGYNATWYDPRGGDRPYAISQAEAIRNYRASAPKFKFK